MQSRKRAVREPVRRMQTCGSALHVNFGKDLFSLNYWLRLSQHGTKYPPFPSQWDFYRWPGHRHRSGDLRAAVSPVGGGRPPPLVRVLGGSAVQAPRLRQTKLRRLSLSRPLTLVISNLRFPVVFSISASFYATNLFF